MSLVVCPHCGMSVRPDRLARHIARVHPAAPPVRPPPAGGVAGGRPPAEGRGATLARGLSELREVAVLAGYGLGCGGLLAGLRYAGWPLPDGFESALRLAAIMSAVVCLPCAAVIVYTSVREAFWPAPPGGSVPGGGAGRIAGDGGIAGETGDTTDEGGADPDLD